MKKTIGFVILAVIAWKVYDRYTVPVITNADLKLLNTPTITISE